MDLRRLLWELHAEQRWLDAMLATLETVSRGPASAPAEALVRSLHRDAFRGMVNLPPARKAELSRLARRVRRTAARSHAHGPRLVRLPARTDEEAAQ